MLLQGLERPHTLPVAREGSTRFRVGWSGSTHNLLIQLHNVSLVFGMNFRSLPLIVAFIEYRSFKPSFIEYCEGTTSYDCDEGAPSIDRTSCD